MSQNRIDIWSGPGPGIFWTCCEPDVKDNEALKELNRQHPLPDNLEYRRAEWSEDCEKIPGRRHIAWVNIRKE